jgi:hypothetical protein
MNLFEEIRGEVARLPPELQLVILCAGAPLTKEKRQTVEQLTESRISWEKFTYWAGRHGLLSIIFQTMTFDPCPFPAKIKYTFAAHNAYNTASAAPQIDEILRLLRMFAGHGLTVIPLKGPLLSSEIHGNPALRHIGDIDLLVHRDSVEDADRILRHDGYRQVIPGYQLTPAQRRIFFHTERHYTYISPHHVDLHWDLSWNYDQSFWSRLCEKEIGGSPVKTLDNEDQFLYLCIHGAVHGWESLKWLSDIHFILRQQKLDWPLVLERASEIGSKQSLFQALLLAHTFFDSPLSPAMRGVLDQHRFPKKLVRMPFQILTLNHISELGLFKDLKMASYHALLYEGAYKIRFLLRKGLIGSADWETVSLPDSLFPLYYLLRPWLWLWRKVKTIIKKLNVHRRRKKQN